MNAQGLRRTLRHPNLVGLTAGTGMLVVALAAVVLLFQAQSEDISGALADLERQNGEIASAPEVRADLVQRKAEWASDNRLIHAANLSLAQADLQNTVKAIVEGSLGTIRSSEPTAIAPTGGLEGVAVQFDLTIPLSRLPDLLGRIEGQRPYLFVSDFHVSVPRNTAPGQMDTDLEVHATIEAYLAGRPR